MLFREVSVWRAYGGYLLAGGGVCFAQLALIGALLVERRRRRRALLAVESSHAELEQRIAERERAERELRENHLRLEEEQHVGEALREADRRKDEFLATLAHELRNPLAAIGTAMESMRHLPNDDAKAAWARDMTTRQVAHLSRMIEICWTFAHHEGKVELRQEPLDIRTIAGQALDESTGAAEAQTQRIVVELPRGADRRARRQRAADAGDREPPRQRRQVHRHAVGRSACASSGSAAMSSSASPDNGIGIAAELLERVFDLFVQGPARGGAPAAGSASASRW